MLQPTSSMLRFAAFTGVSLFILSFVTVLGFCVYRLWLHPLAKYPGPLLGKITNLHAAYHSWKGDLHLDMWRCHKKYGDYIRYGPDRLIFNTAAAMRDTYSFGKNVKKCKGYLTMMHRVSNTTTQRDKTLHAKQRRLLSHGFSDAALRNYETTITSHVNNFCHHLADYGDKPLQQQTATKERSWSSTKDMALWCDYVAFDIMLDVGYGSKSEMVNRPDNRHLLDAIAKSNIRVGVMMPLYYLKNSIFDRWLFPSSIVARYTFLAFVKSLLQSKKDKKATLSERQSVYSILMASNDDEGLGPNEIAAESTNLIVAGSDTTSTVLAAFFFYLSRNPTVYTRATTEIRTKFPTAAALSDRGKLSSCVYLRACIDETMRMAPPIASALFREAEPGGALVDGHLVPAGADVGTCIYSIHHDPDAFPAPFTFSPARWLVRADGSNRAAVARAHASFAPFSLGPRACIGKSLALAEITVLLAHVLFRFDFVAAEGPEGRLGEGWRGAGEERGRKGEGEGRSRVGEFQLFDHLTAVKRGPVLRFRER